jgi:N-acetylglutamate synthase and related acetyltransferases
MRIHYDNESHATDFIRLNEAWISEYFQLEEGDRALARDPMRIVREGGSILTLTNRGAVIGACAVLREDADTMLLARMAVAASERGKGWGRILLATALQRARDLGARRVRLLSNTRLAAAIHLYEAAGFRAVQRGPHPDYTRCDIVMECELPPVDPSGGVLPAGPAPEVEA